ncbi:MAG: hypothetical protein A2Y25_07480 [Candidatus Melainabacteria bacterium GWF2_37_15]|nr:MAG: hypothetical protein A2Y25_07480 [Candidatus Melainabacteria bacterium GWF2_37_15]
MDAFLHSTPASCSRIEHMHETSFLYQTLLFLINHEKPHDRLLQVFLQKLKICRLKIFFRGFYTTRIYKKERE